MIELDPWLDLYTCARSETVKGSGVLPMFLEECEVSVGDAVLLFRTLDGAIPEIQKYLADKK